VTQTSHDPASKPRRKRSKKRIAVIIGLQLFLLVLGLEGALRVRAWKRFGTPRARIADAYLGKTADFPYLVPIAGAALEGDFVSLHINSLGFRGEEFPLEKQPGELRIACLGASTTFCAEASTDAHTWPARLQADLSERYPDRLIRVINAGIPGYCIEHSAENLRRRVLPLDPDVVILYHAHNDIIDDSRAVAVAAGLVGEVEPEARTLSDRLSDLSVLYTVASKNLAIRSGSKAPTAKAKQLSDLPDEMPDHFMSELEAIHQELKSRDIQLVLSTFITKFRPSQPAEVQRANADITAIYMPWMSMATLNEAFADYNAAIRAFAQTHDLPVVIDTDSIPADDEHFADFIHFADAGCSAMAKRFADFLVERELVTLPR
jgi:lysophospholipase L1-like esterase